MRGVVLLLAAGEGSRFGEDLPKAFVQLRGVPLVRRAAEAASNAELVDHVVVAVPASFEERTQTILGGLDATIVAGGATRQASAAAALAAAGRPEAVAVHDAARALCPSQLFDICLRELDTCEAVCPALPLTDTVKEVSSDEIVHTLDRMRLVAVQTPQAFRTGSYARAHEAAAKAGIEATDDAALVERLGVTVRVMPGDPRNIKITTAQDLAVAEALLDFDR